MAAAPLPVLPDDLVEEIFLRLPPDEPAWLLRASLISKDWGRTISSPAFRRRLHDFHGAPPVLGFLHNWDDERMPRFVPTTSSSFALAVPDSRAWRAVDFRHGRALFISEDDKGAQELLLWEPFTGTQRRVPVPELFDYLKVGGVAASSWAAVFCAADGCDHRDCHGDPFGLLFLFSNNSPENDPDNEEEDEWTAVAWEHGHGGNSLTIVESEVFIDLSCCSSVLVGRSLLYFMCCYESILEYDLAIHSMTELRTPPSIANSNIMLTKDGALGVAEYEDPNLKLWTKEPSSDGTDAHWVLSRVINLLNLLPVGALVNKYRILEFAEGTNTIVFHTATGIFTFELQAEKARKVCDSHDFYDLIPIVSFYTPVPRGEHQDLPLLGPSEEAGGEVGEEKEEAIEQPQQLFDKGSNAIEEGDLVESRFSHALNTRIPSHGEIALECASTALLYKGTTSKDGAGNSITSGSNVEDVTPSQKGESKEGESCGGGVSLQSAGSEDRTWRRCPPWRWRRHRHRYAPPFDHPLPPPSTGRALGRVLFPWQGGAAAVGMAMGTHDLRTQNLLRVRVRL